jgi:ketopantoate reductase
MNGQSTVVVWGLGEMGHVFARALLRAGHTIVPMRRGDDAESVAGEIGVPALVMVCVGERDLGPALASMPARWRPSVGLVQNELLPRDWKAAGIEDPTVAVVWFEKKPGTDVKVILPTPVAGPAAELVANALLGIGIDARVAGGDELVLELVKKNLYIFVANVAGLAVGGTVGGLLTDHRALVDELVHELVLVQSHLAETTLDEPSLRAGLVRAFEADPDHKTMGRTAPDRLARVRAHAAAAGIETPRLDAIAGALGGGPAQSSR